MLAVAAVFYLVAAYTPTPGSSGAAETGSAFTCGIPAGVQGQHSAERRKAMADVTIYTTPT